MNGHSGPNLQLSMNDSSARVLPRSRVDKQQEAKTESGEQAGKTRTVMEGLGNHRFRSHHQQRSRQLFRDTPARRSPAPTDMAIAIA